MIFSSELIQEIIKMSRTYRKISEYEYSTEVAYKASQYTYFEFYENEVPWNVYYARARGEMGWNMATPSWWTNEMLTRPQRRKTRVLENTVLLLEDYEDAPEFPLAKKPEKWYW